MGLEEMTGQLLGSMMSHRGSLIASGVELAALTEKYAGSCAITKAFAELDCRVLFFDVIYGEAHDCTKPKGFRRWILSKACSAAFIPQGRWRWNDWAAWHQYG